MVFIVVPRRNLLQEMKRMPYYRKGCFGWRYLWIGLAVTVLMSLSLFIIYPVLISFIPAGTNYDTKEILTGLIIGVYISAPILGFSIYQGQLNKKKFLQQVVADTVSKKWLLAVSAIYALESSGIRKNKKMQQALERLDFGSSMINEKINSAALLKEWNIADKASLLKYMDGILLETKKQDYNEELLAWDLIRLCNLARIGYQADILNDTEAWAYITKTAKPLQSAFHSWKAMSDSWKKGLIANNCKEKLQTIYAPLFNWLETNEQSPWQKLPWKTLI